MTKMKELFYETYHRESTDEDLADYMKIPLSKVSMLLELSRETIYLDKNIGRDEREPQSIMIGDEKLAPEELMKDALDIEHIKSLMDAAELTEGERQLIKVRFGFDQDNPVGPRGVVALDKVGEILGLTSSREIIRRRLLTLVARLQEASRQEAS
jgi:DNA-directed RNA polymerase sigma subunit (sigma70/sigma32)